MGISSSKIIWDHIFHRVNPHPTSKIICYNFHVQCYNSTDALALGQWRYSWLPACGPKELLGRILLLSHLTKYSAESGSHTRIAIWLSNLHSCKDYTRDDFKSNVQNSIFVSLHFQGAHSRNSLYKPEWSQTFYSLSSKWSIVVAARLKYFAL